MSYKEENTLDERKEESAKIRERFADRVPVIVEKAAGTDAPDIDKKKFLVPGDLSCGQFLYVVRKRLDMSQEQALFIFVGSSMPANSSLMAELDERYRDEDGFLYMSYSGENTFGGGHA